jgi:hypothetical protein
MDIFLPEAISCWIWSYLLGPKCNQSTILLLGHKDDWTGYKDFLWSK